MAKQKFQTEFSLLQATRGEMLVKPFELYELKSASKKVQKFVANCHIYFVCERPRVRMVAAEASLTEFRLVFKVSLPAGDEKRVMVVPREALPSRVTRIESCEGGVYVLLYFNDEPGPKAPLEILLPEVAKWVPELSMLNVVYIGQAFGDGGNRSAVDRLLAHSTLQRVLADQAKTDLHLETVIVLFDYADPRLMTKIVPLHSAEVTGDEDDNHIQTVVGAPLLPEHLVSIAESSLIRHFQPRYNVTYKDAFPTSSMKHLQGAYRVDLCSIITEIDTADTHLTIGSPTVHAAEHHIASFDLHDQEKRLSFFTLPKLPARE